MTQSHGITELLIQWSDGDKTALEQLMPRVEREKSTSLLSQLGEADFEKVAADQGKTSVTP